MHFWIDPNEIWIETTRNGKKIIYQRCGCNCCHKCWFRPDIEMCLYGGPYTGYEKAEDK